MKVLPLLLMFLLQQTPNSDSNLIEDVLIRGNKISAAAIKLRIQSKRGEIYNPSMVSRDVRSVYALEVFDDVWVEEEAGPQGGKILIFWVKEKPKIQRVDYKGLTSITQSDVLKALAEKKASISQESSYDETKIRRAVQIIKSLLAEKGRQKAEIDVTKDTITSNRVVVTINVEEGPKIKIEKIDIQGNNVFSDRELKKAMKLVKETNWLTVFNGKDAYHEGKLAYDINNISQLYGEHGYARVNISEPVIEEKTTRIHRTLPFVKPTFPWGMPVPFWSKTVDRIFVTLKVEENDQYHVGEVKVTGVKAYPEALVKLALGLTTGDVYNQKLLRDSFESLKKVYGNGGHINFVPSTRTDIDDQKKIVNLDIEIDEGKRYYVSRINFSGNTTTRDKVIRREVVLWEGQPFNSAQWDMSRMRLNQLGYFEEIKEEDAKVDPHPTEPEVNVTLKVQEKGRNTIGFNGGVSGIGGTFLGFNYETNNFLGFGETLSLNFQGGTRQTNVVFSFSEPYFLDRPLSLGFSLFHSNYRYDQARELFGLNPNDLPSGLGFENRLSFEQKRDGFSLYGSYPVKVFSRFGMTFQLDNSQTDAVNPATRDYFGSVNSQEQTGFVSGSNSFGLYRTRKMVPSYSYSSPDYNPYYPTSGQSLSARFEYTGGALGGNTNFYRPTVEYMYYKPHTRHRNVIAMRLMASHIRGFSGTSSPFYERFYPGGDYDIRGFEFRSIGPISFLTRMVDTIDPETGGVIQRPFDDIVYVGGDSQAVLNLEYRIPIVGRTVSVAPFMDVGNAWTINKKELTREVRDFNGLIKRETAQFLPGTNSGVRMSTGIEIGVTLPVLNAPFRLIMAWNPQRLDRVFNGPTTGLPFALREEKRAFKFTVGKTFN